MILNKTKTQTSTPKIKTQMSPHMAGTQTNILKTEIQTSTLKTETQMNPTRLGPRPVP